MQGQTSSDSGRNDLNPSDVGRYPNKPFKGQVWELYNEWMAGDNQKTPTSRQRRPSLATVSSWVSFWQWLPDGVVAQAFKKCSIMVATRSTSLKMTLRDANNPHSSEERLRWAQLVPVADWCRK